MDILPELIGLAGLGVISWFANRITSQLDVIHNDLKNQSERIVKLEVVNGMTN